MKIFNFGPYKINASEIFYSTPLSMALVNYKPVVPGHVLVIPKRIVPRYSEMTLEETIDFTESLQIVSQVIEKEYDAEALTVTIQDGEAAGQTVPHVHVHIMPRRKGDILDGEDREQIKKGVDNDERKPRSMDDMAREALVLRALFRQEEDIWSCFPYGFVLLHIYVSAS